MEKKLNECYEKIYRLCKETLPIEWKEVKIWAEKYSEENAAPEGEYWDYHAALNFMDKYGKWYRCGEIEEDFSKEAYMTFSLNMPTEVIEDINRIFEEAGMERFKVFTFTVDAEGHFEVNFQYEYSQGEDFLERMVLWEYETIGFTGANYHKNVIRKYHPEAEL